MAWAKSADMTVLLTIEGDKISSPGSEWYERLREALWEALIEVQVYVPDNDGTEVGPYTVTVTSVGPSADAHRKPA
jgi:hypothetical protein